MPTTLKMLMGRLDDRLKMYPTRPTVTNSKLQSEDFSPLFGTDEQYSNLRAVVARYRKWIDEAHATEGRQEIHQGWQKVFGFEFAKGDLVKAAADSLTEGTGTSLAGRFLDSTAAHLGGIVDMVWDY